MRNAYALLCACVLALALPAIVGAEWLDMDVPVGLAPAGSALEDPAGTWTVQGSGADIWGTADQFHYLFDDVALGDEFAVSCHMQSLTGSPNAWAKAGLMARTADPVDPDLFLGPETYAYCAVTNANGTCFQYRDGDAAGAAWSGAATGSIMVGPADIWLLLVREGDVFRSYLSTHLPIWQPIDEVTFFSLAARDMHVGIAVTSHDAATLATAVVDSIDLEDPGIAANGPSDPICFVDGENVELSWLNGMDYDAIAIYRESELGEVTLVDPGPPAGSDQDFVDTPGDGEWTYYIVATVDEQPCAAVSCSAKVGGDSELMAIITVDPTTPTCGGPPLTVRLDGLASFSWAVITDYLWDYGDGETDDGDMVEYTYEEPGFYTVTLTAMDDTGAEDTAIIQVNVFTPEVEFECDPPDSEPGAELTWAFAFGNDGFTCETYNDPAILYEKVAQGTLGLTGVEYDSARGWGYELTRPGATTNNGWGIYGPFDDSPNTRGKFPDTCPEQLYDQFIGCKNYTNECRESPCPPVLDTDSPEGIHFRIDVDNGTYRFVGAFGESDNVHAHTIIVENGGEGEDIDMENAVVLVRDHDQAQWCIGETDATEVGEGVFARVGFNCRIPPPGDGVAPSPQFVNMDENGLPTFGPPNSPTLEVTEGYIRMHQLQGVSNDGVNMPRDPNGADAVILEVWEITGAVEICDNDVDDDGDTLVDCDDPDCEGAENCDQGVMFVRGDANSDDNINLTDGIVILNHLYLGSPAPACMDAADLDDDGGNLPSITDAIRVFNWLFIGGPAPAAPTPETANYVGEDCGPDPTDDDGMDCVTPSAKCGG